MDGKRKRDEDLAGATAVVVPWDALLQPNFEELSRQFPAFGRAWRVVEDSRQKAIAAFEHQHMYDSKKQKLPHAVIALETYITPEFSLQLTRALLHVHWQLALPAFAVDQHLCPPVPNRFFLVDWIQQTLLHRLQSSSLSSSSPPRCYFDTASTEDSQSLSKSSILTGLDIGTGASCIYPLLFAATAHYRRQESCCIYATDIDPSAVALAVENVQANRHHSCFSSSTIVPLVVPRSSRQHDTTTLTTPNDIDLATFRGPFRRAIEAIAAIDANGLFPRLDFVLTNPPFDDDNDDNSNGNGDEGKTTARRDGRARTPLTRNEGWYPGGDVAFVMDIFMDQMLLFMHQHASQTQDEQQRVLPTPQSSTTPIVPSGWTAAMCGKKASWERLVHALQHTLGISHVDTAEFGPGHHVRWFLAWTWQRPGMRSLLAAQSTWEFDVTWNESLEGTSSTNITTEITQRLEDYCALHPDWNLQIERDDDGASWSMTEKPIVRFESHDEQFSWLPYALNGAWTQWSQRAQVLLPTQGHFLLDLCILPSPLQCSGKVDRVLVKVHAYAHTYYGKRRVAQIQSQLSGEIGRTNRRWRRKLKQAEREENEAMDIS